MKFYFIKYNFCLTLFNECAANGCNKLQDY
jgi:hypothetical protein